MIMSKLKQQYQNHKGFTLIELILGICLTSMLIILLLSFLEVTLKVNEKDFAKDEMLLQGRYAVEYLKEEITKADKIIDSSLANGLREYRGRVVNFMILNVSEQEKSEIKYMYSYTTYYFVGDKLLRINIKKPTRKDLSNKDILSKIPDFDKPYNRNQSGHNNLVFNTLRKSEISLNDDNIINMNIFLKNEKSEILNFESNVHLRCEVLRWEIIIRLKKAV